MSERLMSDSFLDAEFTTENLLFFADREGLMRDLELALTNNDLGMTLRLEIPVKSKVEGDTLVLWLEGEEGREKKMLRLKGWSGARGPCMIGIFGPNLIVGSGKEDDIREVLGGILALACHCLLEEAGVKTCRGLLALCDRAAVLERKKAPQERVDVEVRVMVPGAGDVRMDVVKEGL